MHRKFRIAFALVFTLLLPVTFAQTGGGRVAASPSAHSREGRAPVAAADSSADELGRLWKYYDAAVERTAIWRNDDVFQVRFVITLQTP